MYVCVCVSIKIIDLHILKFARKKFILKQSDYSCISYFFLLDVDQNHLQHA